MYSAEKREMKGRDNLEKSRRLVIMMAVVRRPVVVHAACVLRVVVWVNSRPAFLFRQLLLDVPGVWFDTNREFKIFLGN